MLVALAEQLDQQLRLALMKAGVAHTVVKHMTLCQRICNHALQDTAVVRLIWQPYVIHRFQAFILDTVPRQPTAFVAMQ